MRAALAAGGSHVRMCVQNAAPPRPSNATSSAAVRARTSIPNPPQDVSGASSPPRRRSRHCGRERRGDSRAPLRLWGERRSVRASFATMSRAIHQKLGRTLKTDAGCLRATRTSARCLAKPPERHTSEVARLTVEKCSTNVTLISSISLEDVRPSRSMDGSADGRLSCGSTSSTFLCPSWRCEG